MPAEYKTRPAVRKKAYWTQPWIITTAIITSNLPSYLCHERLQSEEPTKSKRLKYSDLVAKAVQICLITLCGGWLQRLCSHAFHQTTEREGCLSIMEPGLGQNNRHCLIEGALIELKITINQHDQYRDKCGGCCIPWRRWRNFFSFNYYYLYFVIQVYNTYFSDNCSCV